MLAKLRRLYGDVSTPSFIHSAGDLILLPRADVDLQSNHHANRCWLRYGPAPLFCRGRLFPQPLSLFSLSQHMRIARLTLVQYFRALSV